MSQFSGIRAGLATNLATIPGLRTYSYMPDNPTPPCAVSGPVSVTYDEAFNRGHDEMAWEVMVLVSRADEKAAQEAMDTYCGGTGTYSVKTAIESSPTLGGACIDARVTDMTAYETLAVGEVQYLVATFRISILAN